MVKQKIPKEWLTVVNAVLKIGADLRESIEDERPRTKQQYSEWLDKLTGCYMFLIPLAKKYSALKRNNEDAEYVKIRNEVTDRGDKFVSAAADREASNSVAKYRYIRDWLEGWVAAAESGIYTLRKHLSEYTKEKAVAELE